MEVYIQRIAKNGKSIRRTNQVALLFCAHENQISAQLLRAERAVGFRGSGRLIKLPSDLVVGVRMIKVEGSKYALVQMDPTAPIGKDICSTPLAQRVRDEKVATNKALGLLQAFRGRGDKTNSGYDFLVPIDPLTDKGSVRLNGSNLLVVRNGAIPFRIHGHSQEKIK